MLKRRRIMQLFIVILLLPVALVLFDYVYSYVISARYNRWAATFERDGDHVRVGCRAFTKGDGNTVVLMVHGFADSPALFQSMADRLAQRGITSRAMRLPGFAMPMDVYKETSLEQWRAAINDEMNTLANDYERVWILGHSMGGALAIDYAVEHSEHLDGVVLAAPLISVSGRRSPLISSRTWFELFDRLLRFTSMIESTFPMDIHRDLGYVYPRDKFVPRTVYRSMFRLIDSIQGRASELDMPVYMVVSEDDLVVDSDAARHFYDALPSSTYRFRSVQGAGHVVLLDHGWEQLADEVGDFILTQGHDRE